MPRYKIGVTFNVNPIILMGMISSYDTANLADVLIHSLLLIIRQTIPARMAANHGLYLLSDRCVGPKISVDVPSLR
jgi:hypothetical protein